MARCAMSMALATVASVVALPSPQRTSAAADPSQVVFYSDCPYGGSPGSSTYRIDPAGATDPTYVADGSNVRVSPNGKRLAVILNNGLIHTLDVGGGNVRSFTESEPTGTVGFTSNPSWSPDSTKFAVAVHRYSADDTHSEWAIRTYTDDATNTSVVTGWSRFVVTELDWRGGTWLASYQDLTDPVHQRDGLGTAGVGSSTDQFSDISGALGSATDGRPVAARFDSQGRSTYMQSKTSGSGLYVDGSLNITMDPGGYDAFAPGGDRFATIRYRPNAFMLDIVTTGGALVGTVAHGPALCGLDWISGHAPPYASFTAKAHGPGSPTWDFDASGSTATPPATVDKYEWDFGDPDHTTGTGMFASHKYTKSGTYTVTLKVTDSGGLQNTVTKEIKVSVGLIVNSTGDAANGSEAGTGCDTGGTVNGAAECTLRAAIEAANTDGGAQAITFKIDGTPSIVVTKDLPRITAPITIDGTTQAGGWVNITGPDVTDSRGLYAGASDITLTGLVIDNFRTAIASLAPKTTIVHNRIGVDATGHTVTTPPIFGVVLFAGASDAVVKDNVVTSTSIAIQVGSTAGPVTASITENRVGVDASAGNALSTLPGTAIDIVNGSATIQNNTVASVTYGILGKSPVSGTQIIGNHVGVNALSTAFTSSDVAISLNGVPDVVIAGNYAASVHKGIGDVTVTGSNQLDGQGGHTPDSPLTGTATGTNITISGNTLGELANGTGSGQESSGVVVFGDASNVNIINNTIGGHSGYAEVLADEATGVTVQNNRIGVKADGITRSTDSRNGVVFGGVVDSSIVNNVIAGASASGIDITKDHDPASGVVSTGVTVTGNVIGLGADGTTSIGNRIGVSAEGATISIGPNNVISASTGAAIFARATNEGMVITGNTIGTDATETVARPNGVGIDFDGYAIEISSNRIANSTGAAVSISTQVYGLLVNNSIGFGAGNRIMGNGSGVEWGAGSGRMFSNDIRNSTGAGITTATPARVVLSRNSTWNNGGKGIDGTGTPPAPTLDAVKAIVNGQKRLWFVLGALPEPLGIIHLYGNDTCASPNDDEGRHFIESHIAGISANAIVVAPEDVHGLEYAGYTVTFTVMDGGTDERPLGRTSNYSTCVAPRTYEDTSGTGIPDIIQLGLGGHPEQPNKVIFPSDVKGTVELASPTGKFTNVGPSNAPPQPDGVKLASGQFSFQLTGIEPGAHAAVAVKSAVTAASYYRYGPPLAGYPSQWYSWGYNPATELGASLDTSGLWVLSFIDGFPGDDDGVANGTIVDPGGPGDGPVIGVAPVDPGPTTTTTSTASAPPVTTPTTPVTTPTTPVTNPPVTSVAIAGQLPRTGSSGTDDLMQIATLLLGLGVLTIAVRRRVAPGRSRRFLSR